MQASRIVHAGALAIANLSGLWFGFVAFVLIGTTNQIGIQLPVAVVVSLAAFVIWVKLVNAFGPPRFRYFSRSDGPWVYCLAPVLAAVVFVPLHFATTGYLTAFSNVLALWGFQFVSNMFVVVAAAHFVREGPGVPA